MNILNEKDSDSDEELKDSPKKENGSSQKKSSAENSNENNFKLANNINQEPEIVKEEVKVILQTKQIQENPKSASNDTLPQIAETPSKDDSSLDSPIAETVGREKFSLDEILNESDDEETSPKQNLTSPIKKENNLSAKGLEEEKEQDPLSIIDKYENSSRLKEKPKDHICYLEDCLSNRPLNISRMAFKQYKNIGTLLSISEDEKMAGRPSCLAVYFNA